MCAAALTIFSTIAIAQDDAPQQTLFTNVNVFDGFADELAMNTDVLVEGNHIIEVGQNITVEGATVIDGVVYKDIM
jgi:adenine deaminase